MQDLSCAILIGHHIVEQPGYARSFPLARLIPKRYFIT